jgi:hypothetical protein
MKQVLLISFVSLLLVSFSGSKSGASASFVGKWQGVEQCQVVSAPVAVVFITADGPDQVFLSGLYSIQGKVRGVVKGNTVKIPRQSVIDPNFKNMMIEGSLTLGNNNTTLLGVFAILNNEQRDNCTVSYHK